LPQWVETFVSFARFVVLLEFLIGVVRGSTSLAPIRVNPRSFVFFVALVAASGRAGCFVIPSVTAVICADLQIDPRGVCPRASAKSAVCLSIRHLKICGAKQ